MSVTTSCGGNKTNIPFKGADSQSERGRGRERGGVGTRGGGCPGCLVGLSREITSGTKMDGYISCSNNSSLLGGNRRVTGLLVQAVIATSRPSRHRK